MCLDPHLNSGCGWRRVTGLSPPVKYFTDRCKAALLLWVIHVISVVCLFCFHARRFIDALWLPAGKGLTSWLSFVMSNCVFVTSIRILGQVWYLIVSIPDLFPLSYIEVIISFKNTIPTVKCYQKQLDII